MKQFKAGYILDVVYKKIRDSFEKDSGEINGLINYITSFDCISSFELAEPDAETNHPLFCVAHNIITRGQPTFASPFVEQELSLLGFSEEDVDHPDFGFKYNYKSKKEINVDELFSAFHTIDPRLCAEDNIDFNDLDSGFEKSFLNRYIPQDEEYLSLLMEHQRTRSSLGASGGNIGRVDFSIEIPYFSNAEKLNRFKAVQIVKQNSVYIFEIDGKKYHSQLIDDYKDFEIGSFGNNVSHIKEDSVFKDVKEIVERLKNHSYFEQIRLNWNKKYFNKNLKVYTAVLSPILIARIQKTLIEVLNLNKFGQKKIRLAIIERDIPGGRIAIEDLKEILNNLSHISVDKFEIPNIQFDIFYTDEFFSSPLRDELDLPLSKNIDFSKYDVVIDASILSRSNIKYQIELSNLNLIKIRNVHYTERKTNNPILSSKSIRYKDLVIAKENELFEDIPELRKKMEFFLSLIFRYKSFRIGQLPIISRALNNKSVIGLLPTGGGKSITYQLPTLLQPGISVIVDPIRSLMQDQYNGLQRLLIDRAAYINSTLEPADKRFIQHTLLTQGQLQFIFLSPERYVIKSFRDCLIETHSNGFGFCYGVIDEVHTVSEWGHDFRTSYLKLGENILNYTLTIANEEIPLFGLTATASFDVLADIERELNIPNKDGSAIVRYENSIRNEINYNIVPIDFEVSDTGVTYEGSIISLNRKVIGLKKQDKILELILKLPKYLIDNFANEGALNKILSKAYKDYLPNSEQKRVTEKEYVDRQIKILTKGPFSLKSNFGKNKNETFKDGTVIFCPHRKGELGVDNLVRRINSSDDENNKIGYFYGSGDDNERSVKNIDKETFLNLDKFKDSQLNIMVATKAFGMGIDKENVRSTIHLNSSSSIESFVQETGRAGRDKKLSLSSVLLARECYDLDHNNLRFAQEDKEVLTWFHKNSFKGETQEKVIIYELRNKIFLPKRNHLDFLQLEVSQKFNWLKDIGLSINKNGNYCYVKNKDTGEDIMTVGLETGKIYEGDNTYYTFKRLEEVGRYIFTKIKEKNIPANIRKSELHTEFISDKKNEFGIETIINKLKVGEEEYVSIPFSNPYSPPFKKREFQDYIKDINQEYKDLFTEYSEKYSVPMNSIESTIEQINDNKADISSLLNLFPENIEELDKVMIERKYYYPRSDSDTAKAIYRLSSIGIIDDYTIDYANKLYTVKVSKKVEGTYFENLTKLLSRYISPIRASEIVKGIETEYYEKKESGETVSEISMAIEYLTSFIYDKIESKRSQGIDDILNMLNNAAKINDPIDQSESIKEEIFYYFNAKYSRREYEADIKTEKRSASLYKDREEGLDERLFLRKYLEIVNKDNSASVNDNIKHLRGATMRMLRVDPFHSGFRILKSACLYVLSIDSPNLIEEAGNEFVEGFLQLKKISKMQEVEYEIEVFKSFLEEHIDETHNTIWKAFNESNSILQIEGYTEWTINFNERISKY